MDDDSTGGLATSAAALATFAVLICAWELGTWALSVPAWLLPAPSAIAAAAFDWRWDLLDGTAVTLYETLAGFALAIALGVPLACAVVYAPVLRKTLYPILLALQSVPKVAVAPILALWIGFGTLPKVVIVFLVCFFPIFVSTVAGLSAIPRPLLDLVKSLTATQAQIFQKIRFPMALPQIFVGCKVAITFAVIGAVIGEFVGSESGLGYMILISSSQSRTPLAFAAIAVLTLISMGLYYAVEFLERRLLPWAPRG